MSIDENAEPISDTEQQGKLASSFIDALDKNPDSSPDVTQFAHQQGVELNTADKDNLEAFQLGAQAIAKLRGAVREDPEFRNRVINALIDAHEEIQKEGAEQTEGGVE